MFPYIFIPLVLFDISVEIIRMIPFSRNLPLVGSDDANDRAADFSW